MIDIHHFNEQYAHGEALVIRSTISERNKDFILRYRDACFLHGVCGKVRLIRCFQVLLRSAVLLGKNFDTVTRPDIERVIGILLREKKPATVATYKAIIKRFLGFVFCPNEFPRLTQQPSVIAWMTVHVRKRDEPRLQRNTLLTPEDIESLLRVCHNPRDKAFISMLWETGGRISELGNMQLKHIVSHPHGFVLDLDGKTGRRSALIVSSSVHLAAWLSHHPFHDDPQSPLWVHYQYRKAARSVDYCTIRSMLGRTFRRAGITKPFHPHLFRHSRATHVLAKGIMTDAQARMYFGWTSDSTMIGRYAHLVDADTHNALLRENNLTPTTIVQPRLQARSCMRCQMLNNPDAPHCVRCTLPLNEQQAYHQPSAAQDVVLRLAQVLVERGLLDTAARAIHEAELGPTLERMAKEEKN